MALNYIKKCGEACQRKIGIALLTILGFLSFAGLIEMLIHIAQ